MNRRWQRLRVNDAAIYLLDNCSDKDNSDEKAAVHDNDDGYENADNDGDDFDDDPHQHHHLMVAVRVIDYSFRLPREGEHS